MTRVFANGRTVVHRGDGLVDVAGPPDVCKTPTPASPTPVPVPYVNAARSADLAAGSRRTSIAGHPIAVASSAIARSTGDEPGTAGGIVSGRFQGKMKWQSTSLDVRVEGKGVARFNDATTHNGNTFNASWIQLGTGWAYGDDRTDNCPICHRDAASHRVAESHQSARLLRRLYDALQASYAANDPQLAQWKVERNALNLQLQARKTAVKNLKNQIKAAKKRKNSEPVEGEPSPADLEASLTTADTQREALQTAHTAKDTQIKEGTVVKDRGGGGYMIGVMVCKEGTVFAAMSGQKTLDGFARVVRDLGWTLCGAAATTTSFTAQNPAVVGPPDRQGALTTEWQAIQLRANANEPSFNAPGECAAPKLLAGARGHVAGSMSEMYFSAQTPTQTVTIPYQHFDAFHDFRQAIRSLTGYDLGHGSNSERTDTFHQGVTVPSCKSCQHLVPLILCDRSRPCGGAAPTPPPPAAPTPAVASSSTQPVASSSTSGAANDP